MNFFEMLFQQNLIFSYSTFLKLYELKVESYFVSVVEFFLGFSLEDFDIVHNYFPNFDL